MTTREQLKPQQIITGIKEIADQYDAFLLDLWGTIHDGTHLYPGVVTCLEQLKERGKSICLLSNVPRRCTSVIERLKEMGLSRDAYDHIVTSGEAVYQVLMDRPDEWYRRLGQRFYHLGPERDRDLFTEHHIPSLIEVKTLAQAEFILNTGPLEYDDSLEDYERTLQDAIDLKLPMVCANPDLIVLVNEQDVICAGTLAQHYEQLGGYVMYHGKPYTSIYDQCFMQIGPMTRSRTIAIGDTLRTDIRGAHEAGLASCFVPRGIHRKGFNSKTSDLDDFILTLEWVPTYLIEDLIW